MAPKHDDWPLWMKLVWQLLAVGLFVLRGPEFVQSLRDTSVGVDFLQEWASVQNWLKGRPVYAPLPDTVPVDLPESCRGANVVFPIRFNAHPPPAVLLALPFSVALGYFDACLAWNLVSLALLFAAFLLILKELELRIDPWLCLPGLALLLIYNPFRQQMAQGQLNGVLLFLFTLAWRAERRGRERQAGAWIGLAAALKLFPTLFLLFFLVRGRWRAFLAGCTSLLAAFTLTALALGPSAFVDYATIVVPAVNDYRAAKLNASLTGFWIKLLEGSAKEKVAPWIEAPALGRLAIAGGSLLLLGVMAWRARQARSLSEFDRLFSLWLVGMLLLSPITWDHSLLLLTLPLVVLWKETAGGWVGRGCVLLTLAVFSMNHQAEWLRRMQEGSLPTPLGPAEQLTCCGVLFYTLAILFVWLAARLPDPKVPA